MNADLRLILDLIVAICGIIPTIVTVVCLVKNIIKNKNWKLVEEIAMEAMTAAEKYAAEHPEMTGEDKLEMALTAIKTGLAAAGVKVDEALIKQIIAYIQEMCKWSKTVNNTDIEVIE